MVFNFTSGRRPRVGRARRRRGLPVRVTATLLATGLLAGCATRPSGFTSRWGSFDPDSTIIRETSPATRGLIGYPAITAVPDALPLTRLPASLQGDTLATRLFEVGRRAGHHYFRTASRPVKALPPGVPPAILRLDQPLQQHATAAYTLGFQRQIARERADRTDTTVGVVAAVGGVALLALLVVAVSSALNSIRIPFFGNP